MGGSAAAMHEVPLAYVEKETDAAFRVRSKLKTVPAHAPPSRVESLGGGFVLQHDRFVSYRAIGKHVLLWETPVHESSADKPASGKASLAIELPESVAPQGVRVFESLDKQFVSICVVTCAKTIHRYCYKIEPTLFSTEGRDEVAFAMSSLPLQTSISAVCWLDECNVVVGGDDGAMIAINVGLSIFGHSHASFHEVALTDHVGLQWLWGGLGLGGARAHAVLAIVPVPDTNHDHDSTDTLVLSLSADYVLRVWSYEQLSCLCNQAIGSVLGLPADAAPAVAASMAIVDQRVLLHVTTTTTTTPHDIVLLRGELSPASIDLHVARRFVLEQLSVHVRLVDFSVDDARLFSVWRAPSTDYVVQHPLSLTGPKEVAGTVLRGMHAWTTKHAADDDALAKDIADLSQIDAFYMQRLGAPGRFNDECLRLTLSTLVTGPAPTLDGHRLRRALLDAVHRQWSLQDTKGSNPYALRSTVWRHVLAVATKHWAAENVPLGFVSCDLLGSPVLLRRNHMSVFFPASILGDRPATIADLYDSIVLPTFGAFPIASYYASLERQWQSDVLALDVTTSVTLLGVVHAGLLEDGSAGRHVPSVLARTANVLSGDAATQMALLDALVAHLALPRLSDDASMSSQDVAATDLALALHRMSAVVLHDMRAAAAASACFVTFLLDATPSFLAETTLRHLEASVRPALERSLANWSNVYWLCSQTQATSGVPVLQLFAASLLDEIVVDGDLGASTRSLIAAIADATKLLPFLQSNGLHSVLRVVLRHANDADDDAKRLYLLGECLLLEPTKTETVLDRAVRSLVRVVHLEGAAVVVELTTLLKEHVPKGLSSHVVSFLQAILVDVAEDDTTLEFVWYNLFKLYVADGAYESAHAALQKLVALGASAPSLDECVRYFVLQLCDAGRVDVVCDVSWGAFEAQVEELLLWQAANTHAHVSPAKSSQSASALYRLLYSFYVARSRFVHAARAMYSLFLRLELEPFASSILQVQRDALLAASNVLELVPEAHRWFVSQAGLASDAGDCALTVVSASDVYKQLLLVRGKLALPEHSLALGSLRSPEVVSLLLTHLASPPRAALRSIELASAIALAFELDMKVVVRAVTRAWVAGSIPESVLQTTLHHLHKASLSLAAIETALELRVAIPTWLRDSVVVTDGPQLLSLLLKYGALDDALATADALVPATEPLTIDSFGARTSAQVSWLPIALLDTLLASAMQVPALTSQAKKLATKVEAHFRYVKALDTAAVVRV
ncbi:hypothetical protein SDRG_15478 [Saprolegnia diclina VS20]|uniref:Uncharacterized protein n=1 Tax=Saprolegnia diclina (strain VS20) TaxID=1156394 RepID=T0R3R4_SAPDV|nr:hypothetical protein SDRG_15478 [Saprolegnia diclina VS20]EQC26693.1 hypothetical protein SDRG_15478 [Saprolegnia diclina VS20]|eukprot:XP_008619875.1 hypothetical protein SDRG_15478 [Saprolegnia diclina VS20]